MGTSWSRLQLIAELIAEEGTESTKIFRSTPEMERGTAEEVFAIKTYEQRTKQKVEKVCMCISDDFDWFSYSPDGLIKKNGKYTKGIEVKSPDSKTLIMYKILNMVKDGVEVTPSRRPFVGIPSDYKWQVVASFLVNKDQEELDFLVYDARFIDEEAKLYVVNVKRSDPEIQKAMDEAKHQLVLFRREWLRVRDLVLPSNF